MPPKQKNTTKFEINWGKYPMLLLAIFFVLGIFISDYYDFSSFFLFIIFGPYWLFLFWLEKKRWISINLLFYKSFAICLGIMMLGVLRHEIDQTHNAKNHVLNLISPQNKYIQVKGLITQIELGNKSWKMFVDIDEICQDSCFSKKTQTIIYVKGDHNLNVLDIVRFRGSILPKRPPNFRAFDYNQYLERKGIYFTLFVNASEKTIEKVGKGNVVFNFIPTIKANLLNTLDNNISNPLVQGLCKAMYLGDRSDVDDETIKVFSQTGAIHILAVSGLHVGIIMSFLVWILSFVKSKKRWWNFANTTIVIGGTIFFIFLVGASPSVQRAGLLFIILYLTKDRVDKLNSLNTLGIVALVILVIDPKQVLTLSFQFSFIAVLSILLFNTWIKNQLVVKNKFLQFLWDMFVVSVSVQILMAPLIIYYFGFYTTYFFLNSLVAIPMVYIGIFGGLFLSLAPILPEIFSTYLSVAITYLMVWCYDGLQLMNNLPFGLIDQISWTIIDLFLVYIIIAFFYVFLVYKQSIHFKSLIVSLFLLIISLTFSAFRNNLSNEVVFYSVSKGYLIDIFDGDHLYALKNNKLDHSSEEYSCSAYRRSRRAKLPTYLSIDSFKIVNNVLLGENTFNFRGKVFIKMVGNEPRNLSKADIVLIDGSISKKDLVKLSNYTGFVLLLNEVRFGVREALKKLDGPRFTVIDVAEEGSYKIKID